LTFIPVGFYSVEYTIAIEQDSIDATDSSQEHVTFKDNIGAYEFNKEKYDRLIEHALKQDLSAYSNENVVESQIADKAEELADEFFDIETDGFDGMLVENVTKIIHHIAQNNEAPRFIDFSERNIYDMDKLATEYLNTTPLDTDIILRTKFNDGSLHWGFLYKTYSNFKSAFNKSIETALNKTHGQPIPPPVNTSLPNDDLTKEKKEQVRIRDNYTCLCCGKSRRQGVSMQVDHILPIAMGGTNDISNLQTLCVHCNRIKGTSEINYRVHKTPLSKRKAVLQTPDRSNSGTVETAVRRVVNLFYHCAAMCELKHSQQKRGRFYTTWEIVLYMGNDPNWLRDYSGELLHYVRSHLGQYQVSKIILRN